MSAADCDGECSGGEVVTATGPAPAGLLLKNTERIATALEAIASHLARDAGRIEPIALSREDAARFIGVGPETIDYLIRERRLAYVQIGAQRGRVIPVEALQTLIKDRRKGTAAEALKGRPSRGKYPAP